MWNVLIVDDQNTSRHLIEMVVESSDRYSVLKAIPLAKMADIYALTLPVDLIIMDIVMAEGPSGLEAAEKIKKSKPQVKILLVTSMPEVSFMERAREIGVDSFWYKEIEEQPLLNVMDRTMAGEQVYPDSPPSVKLGLADSSEFTDRELEVLRILTTGCPDQEIAARLNISFSTVRTHINHMLDKTGFETRTELAIHARLSGIVIPDI
ncbi:MAG: response regulator transcription factor [Lachnospiraceae bacterium]|jgi:two-component system vancomycin resistance associated response regulator VraR|nr:response regulator transcription factor [Lachnospiraceae bacterium]